jgi:hypothetical protein
MEAPATQQAKRRLMVIDEYNSTRGKKAVDAIANCRIAPGVNKRQGRIYQAERTICIATSATG